MNDRTPAPRATNVTQRLSVLGREWHARLRALFETELDAHATPLEILQAVLDDVERHVEPAGRGRKVFPYTRLRVVVHAGEDARAALESVFDRLEARLAERLAEVRCEHVRPIVDLRCEAERPTAWAPGQWFAIDYATESMAPVAAPAAPAPSRPPGLRLHVLKGTASAETFAFTDGTVSIGRSTDPTDTAGRVRRNRVSFADVVDGVNETVGRAHARLRYDAATAGYRLYDEGSSNGTAILRDGEVLVVPARDPRGVRVCSGDEIQLGRACVQVYVGEDDADPPSR